MSNEAQVTDKLTPAPVGAPDGWTHEKPTREGAYWIRGNSLEEAALIQVKMGPEVLECNLHMNTTDSDFGYGYTVDQLSDDFEWLGPLFPITN